MRSTILAAGVLAAAILTGCGDIAEPQTIEVHAERVPSDRRSVPSIEGAKPEVVQVRAPEGQHRATATFRPRVPRLVAPPDLGWLDVTRAPDWPLWRCTMRHETASRAHPAGDWAFVTRSGKYRGAFAIAATTWQAFAPSWIVARWPNAETAPPFVQVVGAREVRRRVGSGAWGGLRRCGG